MSNSKGNAYPVWGVNINFQVFAVDASGKVHAKSNENFATSVAISEDGTVWALSITPDPDGGGAKLFWSNGDGQWTEIDTPDPGGIQVSGAKDDTCLYLTYDGELRLLDTNANNKVFYTNEYLVEFDYGGGMIWALFPDKPGGMATLHYSDYNTLDWKEFEGQVYPFSLSVSYSGDCYGVNDFNPMYYSKDGKSSGSAGSGLDRETVQISFKNWTYALSTDINSEGNLICEWVDTKGGTFEGIGVRGSRIAASYFRKS